MFGNPYFYYVIAAFLFITAVLFKHRANLVYISDLFDTYVSLKDYLYRLDHSVDDKTFDLIMDQQPGYWRFYRVSVALACIGTFILFIGIVVHFR